MALTREGYEAALAEARTRCARMDRTGYRAGFAAPGDSNHVGHEALYSLVLTAWAALDAGLHGCGEDCLFDTMVYLLQARDFITAARHGGA